MTSNVKVQLDFSDLETAFAYKSNSELRKSWWLLKSMQYPCLVKTGPKFINFAFKVGLPIEFMIKDFFFSHFCGGTSLKQSEIKINLLAKYGVKTLLDYAVEGEKTEKGFDSCKNHLAESIRFASKHASVCAVAIKITGIAAFEILEKKQNGKLSEAEQETYQKAVERLRALCQLAYDLQQTIYIDAEESWIQDTIDDLAEQMMKEFNKERLTVATTIQCYRHDRYDYLEKLISKAKNEGFLIGIKIVRGAYLEKENERAKSLNYPTPINPSKQATDDLFNRCALLCLKHLDRVYLFLGTHNEESCKLVVEEMQQLGISPDDTRVYFSQLLGMSDNISFNLAKAGYNVCKYMPYGPIQSVMPYLFRRAEENSSIKGQSGREFLLIDKERKRRSV